ncbi:MAG: acyl-CoA thioesterase [Proteobacteria bacterium]|nr:acyl-CoA thioesterase [Pseudomonadota bacterium]
MTLRFSDQDTLGHINNVAYSVYAEAGRVEFVQGLLDELKLSDEVFMLVSLRIDFKSQMHYPGTVDVGTCVLRLGNSSITIGEGLFKDGNVVATVESVIVFVDDATGNSKPMPDSVRAALQEGPRIVGG